MSGQMTIYSKDSCPGCEVAKKIAAAWKFEYQVKQLGIDYTAEDLMERYGVRSVPFIVDGDFKGDLNAFRPYAVKKGKGTL